MTDRLAAYGGRWPTRRPMRSWSRLAEELVEEYGITETELLLVDYRLAALLPLHRRPAGDPARRTRPGAASTTRPRSSTGRPSTCR